MPAYPFDLRYVVLSELLLFAGCSWIDWSRPCDVSSPDPLPRFVHPVAIAEPDCDDLAFTDFEVLPPDPQGLDGDGDGLGCES